MQYVRTNARRPAFEARRIRGSVVCLTTSGIMPGLQTDDARTIEDSH